MASKTGGSTFREITTRNRTKRRRVSNESKSSAKEKEENYSRILFAEGVQWKVFEHERLSHTLERTLVFSPMEGNARRVSKYPRNWRSLDDTALFELSKQR